MEKVVTAVLGGGRGTRLWPLTRDRAKPAVPVGGKFRLIDIPISNSLHGGIRRIYVLTQFLSASLHRHISTTYRFDHFSRGFVQVLAAEQREHSSDWYQGTADAIRQNLDRLLESNPTEVLILSGDQLYLMNMREFVGRHREAEADLTVAVKPVPASEASSLGVMRIDSDGRIVEFVEKPTDPEVIEGLKLDAATIDQLGLDAQPGMVLASMGIYTFGSTVLRDLLDDTEDVDFGREIIPKAIQNLRVFAFVENGYWRDIGTIGSFHEANIELTTPTPALDLYDADTPIYTHARYLPGCRVEGCEISRSIVSDGSVISGARIRNSVIGVRAVVQHETTIDRTVFMGATMFETQSPVRKAVPLGIGPGCEIRGAIIDLDARIGEGCKLVNREGVTEADHGHYVIRDGVIVVPRGQTILPGTEI